MQELEQQGEKLINAAKYGDLEAVRLLLANGADVAYKYTRPNALSGTDALYWASQLGYDSCVELLLKAGANPNEIYYDGTTPLHLAASSKAASSNKVFCINVLLKMGADHSLHKKSTGSTPLHIAVRNNFYESVEALLLGGADPEAVDNQGKTPIAQAVSNKQVQSTKLLLQAGARPSKTLIDNAWSQLNRYEYSCGFNVYKQEIEEQDVIKELLQEYQARWCGMREFCKAQHPRLGAESPAQVLSQEVYIAIFEQLLRLQ